MKISDAIKRIMLIVAGAVIGVAGLAGFQRYRQLHRKKQMVVQAVIFILTGQTLMNILFAAFPFWTLTLVEWNMLVFSSVTSVAAVYFALYGYWRYYAWTDAAKDEIYDRLGIPFIRNIAKLGKRIDERFSKLTPEQRTRVLNVIDNFLYRSFDKINDMAEPKPKPKRKKVRKMIE